MLSLDSAILDHIAIATNDLESTIKVYEDLGFKFSDKREVVESQKVKTAFCHVDKNAHIELLEPTDPQSTIQKFIDKNGPGIHHLCFKVKDILLKQKEMEQKGYRFIYREPTVGAGNCLVNFIHPKSSDGVLIEISQKMDK
ncbi:MAG: methylmalonyl-CoA epimerase [Bacteriovoracaceae bacterium]|nr:methylmalonyl-CoA epimerase [Bacteriovoracaceae bacterium]